MTSDGLDWGRLAAVKEQAERIAAERRAAAERTLREAQALAEAAKAAGLTVWRDHVSATTYEGADVASFWVDAADGWKATVAVIPAGWTKVLEVAIRECRVRVAEDLLAKLRAVAREDGTWPEAETAETVRNWLRSHAVDPDAQEQA